MIFVGDITLPYANSVKIKEMPSKLSDHYWFGNLEGGIIDNANNAYQNSQGVFNDFNATKELIEVFNFGIILMKNIKVGTGIANFFETKS